MAQLPPEIVEMVMSILRQAKVQPIPGLHKFVACAIYGRQYYGYIFQAQGLMQGYRAASQILKDQHEEADWVRVFHVDWTVMGSNGEANLDVVSITALGSDPK